MATRNCIIVFIQDFIEYKREMRDIRTVEWLCKKMQYGFVKNGIQNKS